MSETSEHSTDPQQPTAATSPSKGSPQTAAGHERGRLVPRILVGLVLTLMTGHFVMTALYINPVSVAALQYQYEISSYMEPLFRQRWSLFAPNPPLLNRRLDYQCQTDGQEGEWISRSEELIKTHARRRFSPASRMRRVETAAIAATVGSEDPMMTTLLEAQDKADEAQRQLVEDAFARRYAATIRSSRMAYQLVYAYCYEDLGRAPERLRYRIVTQPVPPFSIRNTPEKNEDPKSMTAQWLAPDEFDTLEDRAKEFIALYEKQKAEKAELAEAAGDAPSGADAPGAPSRSNEGGENNG